MRFLPGKADTVDPGAGPPVCSDRGYDAASSGAASAHVTSCRCWRCAAPKTAAAWAVALPPVATHEAGAMLLFSRKKLSGS